MPSIKRRWRLTRRIAKLRVEREEAGEFGARLHRHVLLVFDDHFLEQRPRQLVALRLGRSLPAPRRLGEEIRQPLDLRVIPRFPRIQDRQFPGQRLALGEVFAALHVAQPVEILRPR